MKVNVYLAGNYTHDMVLHAFAKGIPGEHDATVQNVGFYEPSDLAVVFGIYKKAVPASFARGEVIAKQKAAGKRVIVLETGYVNRGDKARNHFAAGFNGLNGWADFRNQHCTRNRWDKLGVELKPWSLRGTHYILCGQVPWDASVQYVDMLSWLENTAAKLRRISDRPIIYRPHPKAAIHPRSVTGCLTSYKALEEDLGTAYQVITYNSNAAVDAVIAGVPAVACGVGTMAAGVTGRVVEEPQFTPCRDTWAACLAYTQWTCAEMEEGLAWNHLFH